MTSEDIIRMAREAGIPETEIEGVFRANSDDLGRLLAAERDKIKWNSIHSCHADCQNPACVIVREAVAAEREECAKVCDRFQERDVGMQPAECAGAIRARGQI